MADRALRPDHPDREIFELDKDERWQARLAEARARRAIALQEKANLGEAPKRRRKPWEEARFSGKGPRIVEQPPTEDEEDQLDFADRVKSLRKPAKTRGDNGGPPISELPLEQGGADKKAAATSSPASIADRYIEALAPDFRPVKPFVPGDDSEEAPIQADRAAKTPSVDIVEQIAEEYAATMAGAADVAIEATAEQSRRTQRGRGVPAALLGGICLLALLPFTKTVPPVDKGPDIDSRLTISMFEPALGITRPMNVIPRETVSREWMPMPNLATNGLSGVSYFGTSNMQRTIAAPSTQDEFPETAGLTGRPSVMPVAAHRAVLEPVEPIPDPLPGLSAAPAEATAPEGMAEAAPAIPEPLSLLRVTVLVPETTNPALANEITGDLEVRGHQIASVKAVDLKISERNIRFFHEVDRGEAERLAAVYGARLRDFTSFRPSPSEGTVEIWLAGDGNSNRAAPTRQPVPQRQRTAESEVSAPVAVQPRVVIVQRQPSLFGRIAEALGGGHQVTGQPTISDDGGAVLQQPGPSAPVADPAPTSGGGAPASTGNQGPSGATNTAAGTSSGAGTTSGTGTSSGTGGSTATSSTGGTGATGSTSSGSTGATGTGTSTGSTTGSTGGTTSGTTSGGSTGTSGASGGTSGSSGNSGNASGSSGSSGGASGSGTSNAGGSTSGS